MSEINNLVYFLNSIKDILPFKDENDFRNKQNLFNENNFIELLNKLKPKISDETKFDAYFEVEKFNLINNFHNNISMNEIKNSKIQLNFRIDQIQKIVEPLEICRNHTLILGSLEYMSVVMKIEDIDLLYKKDLLEFINFYFLN